jgi:DNA helicase-2/ATP-dependent DNA helicase PcrA
MSPSLNTPQRAAVETLKGPMLVLAGAGTGKTRVVTFRIANLVRHGIQPSRILAVTFTNKAANEMQQRVIGVLGNKRTTDKPAVSTFHSHCVGVLRRHIKELGYPTKFAIYDRGDQESLARAALREIRVSVAMLRPGDLIAQIGWWKTRRISPQDAVHVAETDKQHLAATAYRRYQQALKNAGAVDFDDLLLLTEELFRKFPEVRAEEAGRFDHLLIDEYQDTNASQYRIVQHLAAEHRNLCVVGDDDQSIYGFRGAEVEHILRFTEDWPDAKIIRLERNYRSTAAILTLANRLIAFNTNRHEKALIPARPGGERPSIQQHANEEVEAKAVVADISKWLSMPDLDPRDFAILFRTNEQPRVFEAELRRENLPYILIGGMSFFDRGEVRDTLAFLRIIDAPDDEVALLRTINTPPRGISKKTVEWLNSRAVSEGVSVWEIMSDSIHIAALPDRAREAVQKYAQQIQSVGQRYRNRGKRPINEIMKAWLDEVRYKDEVEKNYPDPNDRAARWSSVEEVINALSAYEDRVVSPTIHGFLDEIALAGRELDRDKEKELSRNAIALMTLHSAKGLEFPHVYMVGMEEGLLPHHRSIKEDEDGDAIAEERRLCYVGVTRAQDRLTFSLALARRKWGQLRESHPSRFLFELIGKADNPRKMRRSPRAAGGKRSSRART